MHETAARFGATNDLLGIVTTPAEASRADFACLLMNAGVIHRIGPHRLNVKIARALAGMGVMSLRLDFSGLGDSAVARTDKDFWEQAVTDLQAAMDYVERTHGISKFVVLGLCSGAVNGYALTQVDRRVIGLMMFDGFAYPTWKTSVLRRWRRFRKLPLKVLLTGALATSRELISKAGPTGAPENSSALRHPSREEFGSSMEDFVSRDVAVLLAYSHTVEQHNYAGQLADTYAGRAFLKRIEYAYVPEIDHAFTSLAAQRAFIGLLQNWVGSLLKTRKSPPLRELVGDI